MAGAGPAFEVPGEGPVVAILLAAGEGRRFDPSGGQNKLLARLDGRSLVATTLANILQAGLPVLAVIRPQQPALGRELDRRGCTVLESANASRGIGHSLADAASALRGASGLRAVLVCLADMPFIAPATYAAVAAAMMHDTGDPPPTGGSGARPGQAGDRLRPAAAAFEGQRGSPVAFPVALLDRLAALSGDTGAGRILRDHRPRLVECHDPAVLRDVDSPDDLVLAAGSGLVAKPGADQGAGADHTAGQRGANFWEER